MNRPYSSRKVSWQLIVAALLCSTETLRAEQQFPYVAYVVHADAYVRSGPGQRYYPTQQLQQGYAVEVYRHDGAGWCAIRPPEESFSWIAAHEVRLVSEDTAEVIAERAVTRVGSSLSPTRSTVQVLLKRGERVAVMSAQTNDDPSWLRVVPPAGEFRWIAAGDLGRQAPLEVSPPVASRNVWTRARGSESPDTVNQISAPVSAEPDSFDHLVQSVPQSSTVIAQPATLTVDSSQVDIVAGSPAELQLAQFQGQPDNASGSAQVGQPATEGSPAASSPRVRFQGSSTSVGATGSAELPVQIQEMQLRLSQIVSQPHTDWQFEQMKLEANTMLQQEESADIRNELRNLLDQIAQFEHVRNGYQQASVAPAVQADDSVPVLGPPVDPVAELVENVRQRVREDFGANKTRNEASVAAADKPLYDAVGRLKPVVSRRRNAPQYALVNDRGDVVSFVTPTPDLNLKPYVGRRVGVSGTRGFMTEFSRPLVTAGRVTTVDAPVRR